MKRWIVKQFVQLSEITGRPVPGWIRKCVPEDVFKAMESSEQDLTRALSQSHREQAVMPEDLKERIEDAGWTSTPVPLPEEQPFPSFSWALAAAALLVLGTVLVFSPPSLWKGSPETEALLVEESSRSVENPVEESSSPERGLPVEALSGDVLLNPLADEKERLASDVTNALRYVADSFLPSVYAVPVNEGLRTAEQRLIKSI
jgi:hypothetical protein